MKNSHAIFFHTLKADLSTPVIQVKRSEMKKIICFTAITVMLILLPGLLCADTYGQQKIRIMMQIDGYADGSFAVRYYLIDPATKARMPFDSAARILSTEEAAAFQSAVVTRSWHWNWPTTIGFKNTTDSKPHKGKVKKILNTQINQRRGNNNVPRMKTTTKVVNVKPMSQFPNPYDYYIQLDFDTNNTVVMTADDQFFEDIFGNNTDPEKISNTIIMATMYYGKQGGKTIGTFWIEEADVYLRMDYFSRPKDTYTRLGLVAFRFCLGYQSTVWTHDYMSPNNHHASDSAIKTINSDTWQKISHVVYLSTPRLLPHENEVLDIGGYTLPYIENDEIILGKTPILFLTNLKAYDGAKKVAVKLYRITNDNPPKEIRIVTLTGNTLYYPKAYNVGDVYASIFLNHIRLGRQVELNKLKNEVKNYGSARNIDGIDFEKALKIKVKIFGYLTETGAKKKIARTFWLVDKGK